MCNAPQTELEGILLGPGIINNYNTIENKAGALFVNDGTFDNTSGIFINAGIFRGEGTFVGNLDTGTGIVAPGSSAGTMVVNGDYTLKDYLGDLTFGDGSGTLEIEIGGFALDEFDIPIDSDFMDITGAAFLTGGTIEFSFISGYDISTDILPGQTGFLPFLEADGGIVLDLLSNPGFASTITYDFLGTPEGFVYDVYQDGNALWFSAENTNAIPAPGAIILGCIGVGCVARLRKRQSLN
jgi:hypothetical protein